MKKKFLKPIAMGLLAFTFSCSSTNDTTNTTTTETETMAENDMEMVETEPASNTEPAMDNVNYADIFNSVGDTEDYDILELAKMDENLSTFVELVEQSGLNVSLANTDQDLTVFIPSNEAFQNLSKERYEYLTDPSNRAELVSIIQAHIVPMEISTIQFSENQRIETADGKIIPISTSAQGNNVTIGGANIVKSDVNAANGTIHIVDAVIQPTEEPVGPGY